MEGTNPGHQGRSFSGVSSGWPQGSAWGSGSHPRLGVSALLLALPLLARSHLTPSPSGTAHRGPAGKKQPLWLPQFHPVFHSQSCHLGMWLFSQKGWAFAWS